MIKKITNYFPKLFILFAIFGYFACTGKIYATGRLDQAWWDAHPNESYRDEYALSDDSGLLGKVLSINDESRDQVSSPYIKNWNTDANYIVIQCDKPRDCFITTTEITLITGHVLDLDIHGYNCNHGYDCKKIFVLDTDYVILSGSLDGGSHTYDFLGIFSKKQGGTTIYTNRPIIFLGSHAIRNIILDNVHIDGGFSAPSTPKPSKSTHLFYADGVVGHGDKGGFIGNITINNSTISNINGHIMSIGTQGSLKEFGGITINNVTTYNNSTSNNKGLFHFNQQIRGNVIFNNLKSFDNLVGQDQYIIYTRYPGVSVNNSYFNPGSNNRDIYAYNTPIAVNNIVGSVSSTDPNYCYVHNIIGDLASPCELYGYYKHFNKYPDPIPGTHFYPGEIEQNGIAPTIWENGHNYSIDINDLSRNYIINPFSAINNAKYNWLSQSITTTEGAVTRSNGNTSTISISGQKYSFGKDLPTQVAPVKWSGDRIVYFDIPYDTTKYIASQTTKIDNLTMEGNANPLVSGQAKIKVKKNGSNYQGAQIFGPYVIGRYPTTGALSNNGYWTDVISFRDPTTAGYKYVLGQINISNQFIHRGQTFSYTGNNPAPAEITGTIIINNNAYATNNSNFNLSLTTNDSSNKMQFKCENGSRTPTSATNFTSNYTFNIGNCANSNGTKTIYVKYQNGSNNAIASDEIVYDNVKPSVTISMGTTQATVTVNDSLSGLSGSQKVYYHRTKLGSCPTNQSSYYQASPTYNHGVTNFNIGIQPLPTLDPGNYRLCIYGGIYDRAGNVSDTTRSSSHITISNNTIVGSIIINNGAIATNNSHLSLTLSATNANKMNFSCDGTHRRTSDYEYNNTLTWSMNNAYGCQVNINGEKTVYARYRNTSTSQEIIVNDTIIYDTVKPSVNITNLSATNGGTVTITDTGAGLTAHQPVQYKRNNSSSCPSNGYENGGTIMNSIETWSGTIAPPTNPGTYYLCINTGVNDIAGNASNCTCSTNHITIAQSPTTFSCAGQSPCSSAGYICGNGTYTAGYTPKQRTYTDGRLNSCLYSCDNGYTWNSQTNKCQTQQTTTYYCNGQCPSGSGYVCGSTTYTNINYDSGWKYESIGLVGVLGKLEPGPCRYTCENGYTRNGTQCIGSTPTYSCIGDIPSNAILMPGSDQNLTSDVDRKLYESKEAAKRAMEQGYKCVYICQNGYSYNQGQCVANSGPGNNSCSEQGGCPKTSNGRTCTTYKEQKPAGPCVSKTSRCNNGTWSDTPYNYSTCNSGCKYPWNNNYMTHGTSITAYSQSSPTCPTACNSQTRTCNNGTLSGSYTKKNCSTSGQSCSSYGLSSCPDNCNCSECQTYSASGRSCSTGSKKYKIISAKTGYHTDGNSCVSNTCTGTLPTGPGYITGSNTGNSLWKYTNNTTPRACEYTCEPNYQRFSLWKICANSGSIIFKLEGAQECQTNTGTFSFNEKIDSRANETIGSRVRITFKPYREILDATQVLISTGVLTGDITISRYLGKSGTENIYRYAYLSGEDIYLSGTSLFTRTDTHPTIRDETLIYTTGITTTQTLYENLIVEMGVEDGDCGSGTISKTGNITCTTGYAQWTDTAGITVTPPTDSSGTATCTVSFADDELNTVEGKVSYEFDTVTPSTTEEEYWMVLNYINGTEQGHIYYTGEIDTGKIILSGTNAWDTIEKYIDFTASGSIRNSIRNSDTRNVAENLDLELDIKVANSGYDTCKSGEYIIILDTGFVIDPAGNPSKRTTINTNNNYELWTHIYASGKSVTTETLKTDGFNIKLYSTRQLSTGTGNIECSPSESCHGFSCNKTGLSDEIELQNAETFDKTHGFKYEYTLYIDPFESLTDENQQTPNLTNCIIQLKDECNLGKIEINIGSKTSPYKVGEIGNEDFYDHSLGSGIAEGSGDHGFFFYISHPQYIQIGGKTGVLGKINYDINFSEPVADEFYHIEGNSIVNGYQETLKIKRPTYNYENPRSYLFNFPYY